MKFSIDNGYNRNVIQVSAEEAVGRLRKRIDRYKYRYIGLAARGIWIVIRTFIVGFILMFLEFFILYWGFRNSLLFGLAFLISSAFLLYVAISDLRKRIKKKPVKDSVFIGKSFKHHAKSSTGVVEVGIDGKHHIDYMGQPNHHVLINGSTTSGKTATMLTFIARASITNSTKFLMLDWAGENEEWAEKVGATVWKVPENFKINLFKLNGISKESRASIAMENLIVAAHLTALQATKVKSSLIKFYMEDTEPTVYDLWNALCGSGAGKENILNQRLRAIQRVIGYEPEEFWDGIFRRNNLISLAGLNDSEKSLVIYAIIQRLSELFDKKPELREKPKLMVIVDEAWRIFRREREFDMNANRPWSKWCVLAGSMEFGLVLSTQQLDDVPKVFLSSCSLLMLHQQRESNYMGKDILNLADYESAYLKTAARGEMILFDRAMSEKAQWWNEYVKVEPLNSTEMTTLYTKYEPYIPDKISEPQMPIELQDEGEQTYKPTGKKDTVSMLDKPALAVYRFMVALSRGQTPKGAYRILKEKKWITSDATIYGGAGKLSILSRAKSDGYVNEKGDLTQRGTDILDPEHWIAKQGVLAGSEEHKDLMRKTIRIIQDNGSYAYVPPEKDSFDVGEIKAKTKSTWDLEHLTIYECQTNAIKEELDKCVAKSRKLNAELVFVVGSEELANQIRESTGNIYKVIVI